MVCCSPLIRPASHVQKQRNESTSEEAGRKNLSFETGGPMTATLAQFQADWTARSLVDLDPYSALAEALQRLERVCGVETKVPARA